MLPKNTPPSYYLLTSTNIPYEFKNISFSNYDVARGDPEALEIVESWFPTVEQSGLLLHGAPGKGKTMLACARLNKFCESVTTPNNAPEPTRIRMRQEKVPVYFIQAAEWIALQIRYFGLEARYHRGDAGFDEVVELDRLIQDIQHRVEFLVIDDVGKEHRTQSGFAEDSLDLLIRTRHYEGLSTIYTSNIPVSQWSAKYQESMKSFILRTCKVVEF